jgi:two-component system, NtrC family, response regulator AtoC
MSHALVVDDDTDSAETLALLIADEGFTVATAGTLREARRQIALQEPDVVLVDLVLPDGSGMDLVNEAKLLPNTDVVLVTGHASFDSSIQALRNGAVDYIVKPVGLKHLQEVLMRVARPVPIKADLNDLQKTFESEGHFGDLWGRSAPMWRVYEQIRRVARTSITVFITGESGSGKELVAKTVHDLSKRRDAAFCAVNCGAISPNLIESEIFGHEKGSFTGAERQHIGFFERANGGTLFLDEVTEMPADLQVRLLRVLESGTLLRVGSSQTREVDVRIIAATNRDPQKAVDAGTLRADLFYRLNVFPIEMPPLRDRLDDIGLIAGHFLREISSVEGRQKSFTPEALARLGEYHWPGNVRELRNIVYRAYLMAPGALIGDPCLPVPEEAAGVDAPAISLPLGLSLKDVKRRVTVATFEHLGKREMTAAALGISDKSLYLVLKDHLAFQREEAAALPPLPQAA